MEYVGRVPAPPLDRFIDDIYCLTGVPRHRRDIASAAETLRVVEEELRSRFAEGASRGLDLVRHTGGRLETSYGAVPVGALAEDAGVSGNHLATQDGRAGRPRATT
ncbi:hypothetical protein [Microbispora bryophytorum]|uniref:hypothetical protein n=1 Tax=Microbispora bryophytorum TaxID=1460882 RepID=UPI0033C1F938